MLSTLEENYPSQAIDGFRRMLPADLERVCQIERAANPFPWRHGHFEDCLSAAYHCWVYLPETRILAFCIFSAAVGEAHILNLCVAPTHQRRGIGGMLLRFCLQQVIACEAQEVFLEVRRGNVAARALYQALGFNQYAQRANYYPSAKGREDAVLYCKTLL